MDATARYYKHSGVIGIVGPVLMLVFGVLTAGILGAIYGFAIFNIPLIYINFFVTAFFGIGVGFMRMSLRHGHFPVAPANSRWM